MLLTLVLQSTQDLGNLAHHYFILIFTSVSMIASHSGSINNLTNNNQLTNPNGITDVDSDTEP